MQVDLLCFVELEAETKGNSRHRDTTERDVSQLHVKKKKGDHFEWNTDKSNNT